MAPHRFVWYELMTSDPVAASSFYTQALGWGTAPFGDGADYTMWTAGGVPFGGLMKLPQGAQSPPAWLGYVGVDDVAAAGAEVAAAGGQVLVPATDIPNAGRFSVLADPQGAVFAVHQAPANPAAAAMPPAPICWHELITKDAAAALAWYGARFGWTSAGEHDMGTMVYRMFGVGDAMPAGGMFDRPAEMPVSAWLYYVAVADLDAALAAVRAHGGQVCNGPMDVPGGGRIAQCSDPQGAMFALHQAPPA